MKPRLQLYRRLDAALGDEHEDPRASLVNLVDVMLVFACGLLAALTASQPFASGISSSAVSALSCFGSQTKRATSGSPCAPPV